jgi:hypothetical protein
MSKQEQKPAQENDPEKETEPQPPPPGKKFQIIVVQTAVFAVVFFTIIWLVEDHSAIAAILGLAAIAYLLLKKFSGR